MGLAGCRRGFRPFGGKGDGLMDVPSLRKHHVLVYLDPTDEIRATLVAQKIAVHAEGGDGIGPAKPFTVELEAETLDAAAHEVQEALHRWGNVRVEPLGPANPGSES